MTFDRDIFQFDTRNIDKQVEKFVDDNIKKEFSEKIEPNRIAILASQFHETGGHTECVKRLVSNLSDNYEIKTFLTRKITSYVSAPNKIQHISKYSKIDGLNCQELSSKSAISIMFNLIRDFAPKVLFVFIHIQDDIAIAIMSLIQKYTNIKIVFYNHASHYPSVGFSFADLVIVSMPSTYYIDKIYRKIDKHYIIDMFSDKLEDIKYYSNEEIQAKRKELDIADDEYFTLSGAYSYKFFEEQDYEECELTSPYFEMIKELLIKEKKLKHFVISCFYPAQETLIDDIFNEPDLRKRLIILPFQEDYELLFQSCDVFIDSFPVSSALAHIDLMKFKKPTVVKINEENKLYSFNEYMPKDYPYMFDNVEDMKNGILKLLYNKKEQQKAVELNYKHYLEHFEGNKVKQQYINLIENIDDLEQFYIKADQEVEKSFKALSDAEIKKLELKRERREEIKKMEEQQIEEANKLLPHAKIVHIMHGEKFDKRFVEFVNRNFNKQEHLFLCSNKSMFTNPEWFPVGENVCALNNLQNVNLALPNIEKIICHSLIRDDLIDKFANEPILLKKSYWDMWGLDLYEAKRDKKNDFIRQYFKGYIGKNDEEYAKAKYGMQGKFFDAFYNFPISAEMLDKTVKKPHDEIRIQINNSCDESTLEMLDILSKFKDENIKITTILSYGPYGNLAYKSEVRLKGKKIFGNKFEYVNKWMQPQEYAQYLADNDILILNQNKQQGVGNTLASVYLGKKIFIRSDVSVNKYLNERGIKIFNSDDIENMGFSEFIEFNEKEENCKNVQKYFDEKYLVSLWEKIFND